MQDEKERLLPPIGTRFSRKVENYMEWIVKDIDTVGIIRYKGTASNCPLGAVG